MNIDLILLDSVNVNKAALRSYMGAQERFVVTDPLYGAIGDGITDDTAAIQDALDAAAGNTLYFPTGTYKITANLTIPVDTHLVGDGADVSVIDGSTATIIAPALIYGAGAIGASIGGGLNAAVLAGDDSLVFTSAPAVVAGDLIVIHNTADGSWNGARTYYHQGEFLTVKSLSGVNVELTSAVIDSYADTCVVYKMTPTSSCLAGIGILGNPALTGNLPTLNLRYGRNNLLFNVKVTGFRSVGIWMQECFKPKADHCESINTVPDTGAVESTGIALGGCQGGRVMNGVFMADRHGTSTGGGGLVVDRFNVFEDNQISSTAHWAADFHGCAEFCTYRRNDISNGCVLGGANNELSDNLFNGSNLVTIIRGSELLSLGHRIARNRFRKHTVNPQFVLQIDTVDGLSVDTTRNGTLRVIENEITSTLAANESLIAIENRGSTADNRVEVSRNVVERTSTATYGSLLGLVPTSGAAFGSVSILDNRMTFCGLGTAIQADRIIVSGNTAIRSVSDTQAMGVQATSGGSQIIFENNNLIGGGSFTLTKETSAPSVGKISAKGNTIAQSAAAIPFVVASADEAVLGGNTIGNASDATQTNPIAFSAVGLVHIKGDVYLGEGAPDFASTGVAPSEISFQKTISLAVAATKFPVWTIPTDKSFVPTQAQGRADTDITATNGNFWALGLDAANRRTNYGVCTTAAASSKHSKNAKFRFLASPVTGGGILADAGEIIYLMSTDVATGGAVLASNMGAAAQTVTVRIDGTLIGNMPSLP